MPTPRIPLLFGTANIGHEGKMGVRNSDPKECQEIFDVYFQRGYKELDTSRVYGEGTTEQRLAELDIKDASIDTKVYPTTPGMHSAKNLRLTFLTSLVLLKHEKVRVFYLHAPDRSVPFEETLEEVNKLFNEGLFEIFGLSNYASWEVAEIIMICKAKGYVQPKVYQVMYSAITREMEPELLPCARKFGLRIVVYSPLAGGFFSGNVASSNPSDAPQGGRFDPSTAQGRLYRSRYINAGHFEALELLKGVAAKHGLRLTEIALRWCQHHSVLTPSDGIILGASSAAQLEQNCADSEQGPLPEEVVTALDEAYMIVKRSGHAPRYWR
ncbi:hypothetical protein PLICRDRAFT_41761 [Plicaturopsis crispa FD-325 SS-3]|nr:hypothetical protein PLICRDRAFT_41761 [Plicaturopsis crispa FD-325 SS-3]